MPLLTLNHKFGNAVSTVYEIQLASKEIILGRPTTSNLKAESRIECVLWPHYIYIVRTFAEFYDFAS